MQVGGSHYQKKVRERNKKAVRDEQYVLDICDQVLGVISKRGHRFDFLLGDKNKQGKAAKLPVDAYYERLGLVIEYRERQHTEAVFHFDKPDRVTVSGMGRAAQRKRYDQFRREVLPAQGLSLIEIDYSHFLHNSSKRIKRDKSRDTEIIRQRLWSFIPK
ncbi:MAG: hypothetical protein BGO52_00290 [Sphingobacteriales bacterium 44-61]|nr:MAG: hypothetical protein BGO52_00290 [Sphingobacteriales bacterium 44-61]